MAGEQTLSFNEYYQMVVEHRWVIGLTTVLVVMSALWYNSRMPSIYRSTATLIIREPSCIWH